ncbi:UDP-glucosyltransferase [Holotrichia oblita]|uniref:UDP-glucosyltransferase n=1 Tax=Holotrichia oblita TaxID=644536 RepID=A0ACB9T6Q5_HOLOL|nr:UDP-glucosyltransferase [Holotrichia oblita]
MIRTGHGITAVILTVIHLCNCANILMVTMGGTKSHKIPFWELSRGLIPRGHNITFINAFPQDFIIDGLEEITPTGLVFYVKNFTNWDLLGARMRGEEPVHPLDMMRYPHEACEILYSDAEMKDFLHSNHVFDLAILDGAFPECALGLSYHFKIPFMYINTVGFYTGSLATAGNPAPYSITPFLTKPFTDNMNLLERAMNSIWHVSANLMHLIMVRVFLHSVLKKHFGSEIPHSYELSKNVSFILQNAHATITYPRPYLPNVAEVACIHCKASKPLPQDLEEFIKGSGDNGFIYFSMGSSVRAANMPEYLRRMLLCVFKQLPQRVLWKWEANDMPDIPPNVKLSRWLPQQDLLGHPKIRAFVTHGGLLSMFETIYHGVPIVTIPVFCDHDSNAAKAQLDGYAIQLDLATLTADNLLKAIRKIIHNPKYKTNVKKMQYLLNDQKETPLERAVYWTEYVLKHKGAEHLLSPSRNLNVFQYYLIDVIALYIGCLMLVYYVLKLSMRILYGYFSGSVGFSVFKKVLR